MKKYMALIACILLSLTCYAANAGRVLFIGDSMTGFLANRMSAYGEANGFQVDVVIWDGATVQKYANSPSLPSIINSHHPDMVIVSLGLNNLGESNPEARLGASVDKIIKAVGNRQLIWIGPPSWPGKGNMGTNLDSWFAKKLGSNRYFSTFDLQLPRQSRTNPHPTQAGCSTVIDKLADWIEARPSVEINLDHTPADGKTARPKAMTYKRMKQTL